MTMRTERSGSPVSLNEPSIECPCCLARDKVELHALVDTGFLARLRWALRFAGSRRGAPVRGVTGVCTVCGLIWRVA